jgi:hypothetical protein
MLDLHEQRILGGLVQTSFGKSSIREAGHAIAFKVINHCDEGTMLEVRYETIVNVNSREGVLTAHREYDDISRKMIDKQLVILKSDFKELAGRALKIKEFKSARPGQQPLKDSFLEIISFNPSLLRGKYYRTIQYHIK